MVQLELSVIHLNHRIKETESGTRHIRNSGSESRIMLCALLMLRTFCDPPAYNTIGMMIPLVNTQLHMLGLRPLFYFTEVVRQYNYIYA